MSWGNCSVKKSCPHGDFLSGRITHRRGATALHLTIRQFQRLQRRFESGGAPALRHRSRGQPSPRRLPPLLKGSCPSKPHRDWSTDGSAPPPDTTTDVRRWSVVIAISIRLLTSAATPAVKNPG